MKINKLTRVLLLFSATTVSSHPAKQYREDRAIDKLYTNDAVSHFSASGSVRFWPRVFGMYPGGIFHRPTAPPHQPSGPPHVEPQSPSTTVNAPETQEPPQDPTPAQPPAPTAAEVPADDASESKHDSDSDKDSIDWTPRTRMYEFNITYGQAAPDGYSKRRILINGQSPGPTILANEGDTIIAKVNNFLDVGTSMHWHGMFQNSTPFMDGIPGFSQCPIPANGSLTYNYTIQGQYGTFWYHSHTSTQYTDGQYGAFVVQSKRDPYKLGQHYDDERIVLLSDNYHDFAADIVTQLLSVKGYKGSFFAPSPQSGLINGEGVFDCSQLNSHNSPPGTNCTQLKTPTMAIESGKTYRFRFINSGSHAQHIVSIDEHELEVIGADSTPTKPSKVHRIPLHNGQRHDAIVRANKGHPGDSFLLRSTMMTSCFSTVDPLLNPVANLTLQYTSPGSTTERKAPVPKDWKEAMGTRCVDLKDSQLVPLIDTSMGINDNVKSLGIFDNHFGNLVLNNGSHLGRFFVDGKVFTNYVNVPYLEAVHAGGTINSSTVSSMTIPDDLWLADIVINNIDEMLDHPFHLHGPEMHVLGRGPGSIKEAEWRNLIAGDHGQLNFKNPLRRDTIVVPRSSYAVIRILADLPGVWPLHCHIAMHVASGLMAGIIVHPDKVKALPFSEEVLSQCPSHGIALTEVVPA